MFNSLTTVQLLIADAAVDFFTHTVIYANNFEAGCAHRFFPGRQKREESVRFFPLNSLGHSVLRILHCAGPHPQVHAVFVCVCFIKIKVVL